MWHTDFGLIEILFTFEEIKIEEGGRIGERRRKRDGYINIIIMPTKIIYLSDFSLCMGIIEKKKETEDMLRLVKIKAFNS